MGGALLATVVPKVGNAIQIGFHNTCPLDNDLSGE